MAQQKNGINQPGKEMRLKSGGGFWILEPAKATKWGQGSLKQDLWPSALRDQKMQKILSGLVYIGKSEAQQRSAEDLVMRPL